MHSYMPQLLCPTCKKPVEAAGADFPFCSDRCRVIDLGKWASGDYKISSPVFDPDLLDDLAQADLERALLQQNHLKEYKN